jgi:predicted transcriptional regulator
LRTFALQVDEKVFNLLWRSIDARERELLAGLSQKPEGSDEAALMGNDVVYLRLCKKDLGTQARAAKFSEGAFSLDGGDIHLARR